MYTKVCVQNSINVCEISLNDLRDWKKFQSFISCMGLHVSADKKPLYDKITATKVNKKAKYFQKIPLWPLSWQEEGGWKALGGKGHALKLNVEKRYK